MSEIETENATFTAEEHQKETSLLTPFCPRPAARLLQPSLPLALFPASRSSCQVHRQGELELHTSKISQAEKWRLTKVFVSSLHPVGFHFLVEQLFTLRGVRGKSLLAIAFTSLSERLATRFALKLLGLSSLSALVLSLAIATLFPQLLERNLLDAALLYSLLLGSTLATLDSQVILFESSRVLVKVSRSPVKVASLG